MNNPSRSRACATCGERIDDGPCPTCERRQTSSLIHREIGALAFLIAMAVAGFFLTRAAANANHALRMRDAAAWSDAGEQALASGRADAAIAALRRATAIDRESRRSRFTLASALAIEGQETLARQELLRLREANSEDAEVNLRLARLEARGSNAADAVRYYQAALYGQWIGEQGSARRQVRIELIEYLLAHHQRALALSELLVLSANLPDAVPPQVMAGHLYLRAGDPRRALDHFDRALRQEPRNTLALEGAGEAAFEAGDYARARRYFRVAPTSPRVAELQAVSELVFTRDPMRSGLSLSERRGRLLAAVRHAIERVDGCLAAPGGASDASRLTSLSTEAHAFESMLDSRHRRTSPETIERGMQLVYRIEQQTENACNQRSALDRALLIIGRRYEGDAQ